MARKPAELRGNSEAHIMNVANHARQQKKKHALQQQAYHAAADPPPVQHRRSSTKSWTAAQS